MKKTAKNPVTGDKIQTRVANKNYRDNYTSIFKRKKDKQEKSK